MSDTETNGLEDFEKQVFDLLGQQVEEVSYLEIDYGDKQRWSDFGSIVHSLDYGVQFKCSNTRLFFISWSHQFVHYHLMLKRGAWRQFFHEAAQIQVSKEEPWHSVLPAVVKEISIYWIETGFNDPPPFYPRPLSPEQIDITFGDKTVSFLAGDIESGKLVRGTDNVLVVGSSEVLKKHEIGAFGDFYSISKQTL